MATLPTPPTFTANSVPSIATLNQLASAVSFVSQVPIVVSLKLSGTQAVAATTSTAVSWTTEEVDTDNMHSTVSNQSRLTAQTQGYYQVTATVAFTTASSGQIYQVWFQQTTGSNNPAGAGHTVIFGGDASVTDASTSDPMGATISSMTPVLYVNDYVEAFIWCSSAATLKQNFGQTGHLDLAGFTDGSSCLYAYYVCEGP